jgi:hypothetical protein
MTCPHCLNTGVRQSAESRDGHLSIVSESCRHDREDLEVDLVEATLRHRQSQREHAAAEKLLRSARAFADLTTGTPLATNAQYLLKRSMEAMNLATMNRLRAAQNVNGLIEALRAEGRAVPVVPEQAAA